MFSRKLKASIVIGLLLIFPTFNQFTQVPTPSPDVVRELNQVSAKLKLMWKQKIKDSKVYDKMLGYQKDLTDFYETSEFLRKTESMLDHFELIEAYACQIRQLHELINNDGLNIPNNCGFDYKYQRSVALFTLSMDLINIVLSDVQMSVTERMKKIRDAHKGLIDAQLMISNLSRDIVTNNLY